MDTCDACLQLGRRRICMQARLCKLQTPRAACSHFVVACKPTSCALCSPLRLLLCILSRVLLLFCMGAMEDPSTRAARLRALRQAAGLDTSEQDLNGSAADTADQPVLKFRNYTVRDDKITHEKTAVANPPKYEQPVVEADVDVEGEELLLSVAPKKPNWDLRRDVEPKLDKLERRTQRAMIQLMQNQQHHASEEPR